MAPAPVRTEAWFKHMATSDFLRTRPSIERALGLLGVTRDHVDEIFTTATEIWDREAPVNLNLNRNSADLRKRQQDAIAELRAQHAEVFGMACAGDEEEKFVREKAPNAIFALVNTELRRMQKEWEARVANGTQAASETPTTATNTAETGSDRPRLLIRVYSAIQGVELLKMENVLAPGGGAPSFGDIEAKLFLSTRSPLKVWPGLNLVFVHVAGDGVNNYIHGQDDLDRVFEGWCQSHPATETFYLYAIDNEDPEPDLALQLARLPLQV
ncbi:hypothetical protein PV04_01995 [Phialophora macrospora]|uniref:Uncharacterized protein n=1 Tax=Phialophora macrospora TaxID=1851006 RepID=A0A0D2D8M2_9EURO|nr:hypothetical protein PV04_01995 [Phialophora macrospora]